MKVTMFGTGYVGLVTGACFAEMGNDVLCIDIDAGKVESLQRGEIPIYEPGLESLVRGNQYAGRLRFSTNVEDGVQHGDLLFIAVGTPSDASGSANLEYVFNVARSIGQAMTTPKVVVDKSTVPVGTGNMVQEEIQRALAERGMNVDFGVVSNPEFLKEGAAVSDFMKPDRIIIGAEREQDSMLLEQLYAPFNRNHDKVIHMDIRSAELTKYAANVMLATRISLMNEFANIADRLSADIEAVRRGIGADPRIGHHFIYPGTGYGGSCFPKDVRALIHTGQQVNYHMEIVTSVERVNEKQKRVLFEKIAHHYGATPADKTFALWGLAFKPNTDDMREAPSLVMIAELLEAGASIRAYDPVALDSARKYLGTHERLTLCERREQTLEGADALIILTEWNEFRSPDFHELKQTLNDQVVFDGRNLYDPGFMERLGIAYYAIGRGRR